MKLHLIKTMGGTPVRFCFVKDKAYRYLRDGKYYLETIEVDNATMFYGIMTIVLFAGIGVLWAC